MLTSITPLGERGRGQRWPVTITAYVVGCLLGGATIGLVLGTAGSVLPRLPVLLLAGLVCLLAAVADLAPARLPGGRLPGGRRQVDEDWLTRYRGWVYGAGFGYQLGLAVVTIVTSASTYAVLAMALLTQSPWWGLLVGVVFGGARCVPALALGRTSSHAQIRRLAVVLERRANAAARLTALTLGVAGVTLVAGWGL